MPTSDPEIFSDLTQHDYHRFISYDGNGNLDVFEKAPSNNSDSRAKWKYSHSFVVKDGKLVPNIREDRKAVGFSKEIFQGNEIYLIPKKEYNFFAGS